MCLKYASNCKLRHFPGKIQKIHASLRASSSSLRFLFRHSEQRHPGPLLRHCGLRPAIPRFDEMPGQARHDVVKDDGRVARTRVTRVLRKLGGGGRSFGFDGFGRIALPDQSFRKLSIFENAGGDSCTCSCILAIPIQANSIVSMSRSRIETVIG